MATNLVSEIAEVVSPSIVSHIASALSLNRTASQKAVVAAVPALLAALISYVSKPQGATKLIEVVRKQEPGVLASLASLIGERGQKAFINQGASVLTSLLGGKTFSVLTSAVGQYAGLDSGGSKSLIGLLGPVVLGVRGKQQRDRGLDASGLASLLTSQKSNVIGALPSGALAWHLLSGRDQQVVETTKPPVKEITSPTSEAPYAGLLAKLTGVKAGDTDVGELSTSAVNHLYSSLVGVKDEASAQANLPSLNQASLEFDQLAGLLSQLSTENRKLLAETFASMRPNLDQLLDKALAIPGVAVIIKPAMDAIRSKLEALLAA